MPTQPYPREIMNWTENIYKPVLDTLIRVKTADEVRPLVHVAVCICVYRYSMCIYICICEWYE
ncbi:hypothetical protein EON63_00910 [archaeon]|nr:MAG: hypothetical protein EON63_00910 [archaeon]